MVSGGGSDLTSTGGGAAGVGIGAVSSAGGVLTEGGVARTILLLAHPTVPHAMAHSSASSSIFRIMCSAPLPPDRADE